MTRKIEFNARGFFGLFLLVTLVMFITDSAHFPVALGGEVVFYKDVNFTGPVLQNFTIPNIYDIKAKYGLWDYKYCLELNHTEGQASSLKTSNFIILMDIPRCDYLLNYGHHNKQGYKLALRPGEYPNLIQYLRDSHFPCRVLSFAPYEDPLERQTNADISDIFTLWDGAGQIVQVTNLCGCVDLPRTAYGRVRTVYTGDFCMNLFSEPRCQGKSVKIPPGITAASLDLRRVSFDGVAKSLRICEETPCDSSKETTMTQTITNERGSMLVEIPLLLNLQEPVKEPVAGQTLLKVQPPVSTNCINGLNFTCSTTCGGVLYSTNGAIQYKLREPLESFERCIWIIKPQTNGSRFNLTQVWRGFKSITGKQEVIISEYKIPQNEEWNYIRDFDLNTMSVNDTTQNVTVNGPFIIITLYTNDLEKETSGGVMLEYNTLPKEFDNSRFGYSSDLTMDFGQSICYPLTAQNDKEKYKVSTFLFLPNNHKDGLKYGLNHFVVDTEASMEINECCNSIIIYKFTGYKWKSFPKSYYRNHVWEFQGRRRSIVHDDMVLIVLQSYADLPKGGFCMNSSVEYYKVCVNSDVTTESVVMKIDTSPSKKPEDSSILSIGSWVLFIIFLIVSIVYILLPIAHVVTQLQNFTLI